MVSDSRRYVATHDVPVYIGETAEGQRGVWNAQVLRHPFRYLENNGPAAMHPVGQKRRVGRGGYRTFAQSPSITGQSPGPGSPTVDTYHGVQSREQGDPTTMLPSPAPTRMSRDAPSVTGESPAPDQDHLPRCFRRLVRSVASTCSLHTSLPSHHVRSCLGGRDPPAPWRQRRRGSHAGRVSTLFPYVHTPGDWPVTERRYGGDRGLGREARCACVRHETTSMGFLPGSVYGKGTEGDSGPIVLHTQGVVEAPEGRQGESQCLAKHNPGGMEKRSSGGICHSGPCWRGRWTTEEHPLPDPQPRVVILSIPSEPGKHTGVAIRHIASRD